MLLQQRNPFRTEGHLSMVRLLGLDVSHNRRNQRRAHAERRVPLLPREFAPLLVGPSRRIRFDRENRLGQRQRRRNLNQQVHVIVHPAHRVNDHSVVFADASRVGPQAGLKIFRDELAAILRAENDVDSILSVRMRQLSHLRRWTRFAAEDPAFPRWAKLCRAYGAGATSSVIPNVNGPAPFQVHGVSKIRFGGWPAGLEKSAVGAAALCSAWKHCVSRPQLP